MEKLINCKIHKAKDFCLSVNSVLIIFMFENRLKQNSYYDWDIKYNKKYLGQSNKPSGISYHISSFVL